MVEELATCAGLEMLSAIRQTGSFDSFHTMDLGGAGSFWSKWFLLGAEQLTSLDVGDMWWQLSLLGSLLRC